MNILCENNAFQHIKDCIDGTCDRDSHYQIEDFLQLCVQIILHDKIHIAGTVPDNVFKESEKLIKELETHGIKGVFDIEPFGGLAEDEQKEWAGEALEYTLKHTKEWLPSCLKLSKTPAAEMYRYFPPLNDRQKKKIDGTTEMIQLGQGDALKGFWDLSTIPTDGGLIAVFFADGMVDEILAYAKDISQNDKPKAWNVSMTLALMLYIRAALNVALARRKTKIYSPSVSRVKRIYGARPLGKLPYNFYTYLENVFKASDLFWGIDVKGTGSQFQEITSVIVSPLTEYLVHEAEGKVSKIIDITLEMRARFKNFRYYLQKRNKRDKRDIQSRLETRLGEILRNFGAGSPQTNRVQLFANIQVLLPALNALLNLAVATSYDYKLSPNDKIISAFAGMTWTRAVSQPDGILGSPEERLIADCTKNSPK